MKQRWIDVDERLPEPAPWENIDESWHLVQLKNGAVIAAQYRRYRDRRLGCHWTSAPGRTSVWRDDVIRWFDHPEPPSP